MLWKIVKGVVAAVLVTKITERYFKNKSEAAPVQMDLDIPAKPPSKSPRVRKPAVKRDAQVTVPAENAESDPQNATESTI